MGKELWGECAQQSSDAYQETPRRRQLASNLKLVERLFLGVMRWTISSRLALPLLQRKKLISRVYPRTPLPGRGPPGLNPDRNMPASPAKILFRDCAVAPPAGLHDTATGFFTGRLGRGVASAMRASRSPVRDNRERPRPRDPDRSSQIRLPGFPTGVADGLSEPGSGPTISMSWLSGTARQITRMAATPRWTATAGCVFRWNTGNSTRMTLGSDGKQMSGMGTFGPESASRK